jgi:hypothetical protein
MVLARYFNNLFYLPGDLDALRPHGSVGRLRQESTDSTLSTGASLHKNYKSTSYNLHGNNKNTCIFCCIKNLSFSISYKTFDKFTCLLCVSNLNKFTLQTTSILSYRKSSMAPRTVNSSKISVLTEIRESKELPYNKDSSESFPTQGTSKARRTRKIVGRRSSSRQQNSEWFRRENHGPTCEILLGKAVESRLW